LNKANQDSLAKIEQLYRKENDDLKKAHKQAFEAQEKKNAEFVANLQQ